MSKILLDLKLLEKTAVTVHAAWNGGTVQTQTVYVPDVDVNIAVRSSNLIQDKVSVEDLVVEIYSVDVSFSMYFQTYIREYASLVMINDDYVTGLEFRPRAVSNGFFTYEENGVDECNVIKFDYQNLTEEKYFQYSTVIDIPITLQEVKFLTGDNTLPKDRSVYLRYDSACLPQDQADVNNAILTSLYNAVMDGVILYE